MDYFFTLAIFGIAALGMAWMPALSEKIRISYSLIYVCLGIIVYLLFDRLPMPDPFLHPVATIHFTELVVIVAIMGTGLKIDEPFSLKGWRLPFRLISLTMLGCIAAVCFLAWYFLKMDLASALLLGAVFAPTDPVLASDVQVGPPQETTKDNIKFAITAEGGMNDGSAFPFVWLAIIIALANSGQTPDFVSWFLVYGLYKIAAGIICGLLLGKGLAYIFFKLPEKYQGIKINDGFVALCITLIVYGLTELVKGYGFIAVFVCAVTLRNVEMQHKLHRKFHAFTDQIERILVAITLILFGGSLVNGILDNLTWPLALFGLAFLFAIRPVIGWFSLMGTGIHPKEKRAISFFGIRGIGSFFYTAFALQQAKFDYAREIWSVVAFIVLVSIIIHGLTASRVMKKLDDKFSNEVV